MAVALRWTMAVIALACAAMFLWHPWWFPAPASAQAASIDRGIGWGIAVLGGLFVLSQIGLFLILGRTHQPSASNRYGNWKMELAWTIVVTAIFFWFNVWGTHLWSRMTAHAGASDAVQVEVTGIQFQWYFRYPGPDGILGKVNAAKFARPDEGNPLGIDPSDRAGGDDIVSSSLVLPVGRQVDLLLRAQDVIHSVFIPAMRFKQDAVPGMDIHAHFTPIQTGTYELVCSQLCGLGHYRMRAQVQVVTVEQFKQWLKFRESASVAAPAR